jgi:uncharacterized protein
MGTLGDYQFDDPLRLVVVLVRYPRQSSTCHLRSPTVLAPRDLTEGHAPVQCHKGGARTSECPTAPPVTSVGRGVLGGWQMEIFLPVAGTSIGAIVLVGAGALVGFLSGLLGVGGGFLLTPLLMMLGIDPVIAAASGTNAIVGASASGTLAHLRARTVDMKLGGYMLAGGVVGGGTGTLLVRALRGSGNADVFIVLGYIALLATMGVVLFVEGLTNRVKGEGDLQRETLGYKFLQRLPFHASFPASGVTTSALAPLILGGIVGVLSALLGVGGGFFLIPAMSYFLAVPMRLAVGTSLFQMLFTSASVTVMQAAMNHSVDAFLAMGLLVGATAGAQAGVRAGKVLRGDQLKVVLALLLLALSAKMLDDLLILPRHFLTAPGGR